MPLSEAALLNQIGMLARQAGLGEQGALVAQAIARTEGALAGQVGDNGQSFGPYQFHVAGMLPAYAQALGTTVGQAAAYARRNPLDAAKWALNGYLGQSIKEGMERGLSGPQLAIYAQTYGQRSQQPERAGQAYKEDDMSVDPSDFPWNEDLPESDGGYVFPGLGAAVQKMASDAGIGNSPTLVDVDTLLANYPDILRLTDNPLLQGRLRVAMDMVRRTGQAVNATYLSADAADYRPKAEANFAAALSQFNAVSDDIVKSQPKPVAAKTPAELAKEAYDEAAYKAKLDELNKYGPQGPPRVSTGSTSSPAAWAQAQEQAAAGEFERGTEFPWKKDTWQQTFEQNALQNQATNDYNQSRLGQEKELSQARLAQEKLLNERDIEANWRRAQLQAAEGLYGTNAALFPKMAAAAPFPGQEYHVGYEPGGIVSEIARRDRMTYDPEKYRIGLQTFDPAEWWRRAQAMAGGV